MDYKTLIIKLIDNSPTLQSMSQVGLYFIKSALEQMNDEEQEEFCHILQQEQVEFEKRRSEQRHKIMDNFAIKKTALVSTAKRVGLQYKEDKSQQADAKATVDLLKELKNI